MYSELYTAASGMRVRLDQMDLLTNNLANVNSIGFKIDEIALQEAPVLSALGGGRVPSHVRTHSRWIDFSPGNIQNTGGPLDLALEGEGFFVIQTPDGVRLTRDGRFSLDADGRLVLRGMPVEGQGGEIVLDGDSVVVKEDGRILKGGGEVARLRVVRVYSTDLLERTGEGLFRVPPDGQSLQDMDDPVVRQGALELSNANAIKLMVQMIDVVRSFEMQQRVIQTLDRLAERAIQGLGRTA